jgi:hypothetical protein
MVEVEMAVGLEERFGKTEKSKENFTEQMDSAGCVRLWKTSFPKEFELGFITLGC